MAGTVKNKVVQPSTSSSTWRTRYEAAYQSDFRQRYPIAFKDQGYPNTTYPKVSTANGLTMAIIKYITWMGYRATRISATGRIIKSPQRQQSGTSLMTNKWIPGGTRRGSADVSSTIKINSIGRSVMWEIKIGNDKPSEYQIKEQALERKAGGEYFFVKDMDMFFELYDGLMSK